MDHESIVRSLLLIVAVPISVYTALNHVSKYLLVKAAEGKIRGESMGVNMVKYLVGVSSYKLGG